MASGLFGATPTTVKQVKCCFSQEAIKGWKSRSAENFTSVNYGNRSFRPMPVRPNSKSIRPKGKSIRPMNTSVNLCVDSIRTANRHERLKMITAKWAKRPPCKFIVVSTDHDARLLDGPMKLLRM